MPNSDAKMAVGYGCWASMVQRCEDPKHMGFHRYGGAGVRICDALRAFVSFQISMGDRPSQRHSIDRFPEKNGHYACGECEQCKASGWGRNVRWATKREQSNNRRDNRFITFGGRTLTATEWGRELGVEAETIKGRLARGWPVEKALTTRGRPDWRNTVFLTFGGRTQTVTEWARETGIHYGRIQRRIKGGWSVEEALTTPIRGTPPRRTPG